MEVNKEKIRYLSVFFDICEIASQEAEIMNGAYGSDTVIATYPQFQFRRFRSSIYNVKDAPLTENMNKIKKIIEVNRYVSSRSIAQKLQIDHKAIFKDLHKEVRCLGVTPSIIKKKKRIYICEAFAKQNVIDQYLKRIVKINYFY